MKINHGLNSYQVFQRDEHDQAEIHCSGTASVSGRIDAYVVDDRGWSAAWNGVGQVHDGSWEVTLPGLPTGGPYRIRLLVTADEKPVDYIIVESVLVGDLWVLAGQSNMDGVGDLIDVTPSNRHVNCLTMWDEWNLASEPLHALDLSVDPIHNVVRESGPRDPGKGAGLGLPFAVEMVQRTGVPVGLIPCAHGGTSMTQWDPALKDQGGDSLYGAMMRRIALAGGQIKGVLWYQGCSETGPDQAARFPDRFAQFVAALRADVEQIGLPFFYVQIGRFAPNTFLPTESWADSDRLWSQVRELQRQALDQIENINMVASIDLDLDDLIHIGTQSLKCLGHRMAQQACVCLFGHEGETGPRLQRIQLVKPNEIQVSFSGVNGRLTANGRVSGFVLLAADGRDLRFIYSVRLLPDRPNTVLLKTQDAIPADALLIYGNGMDPYCNLSDEAGMAVPAFGPLLCRDTSFSG